MLADAHMHLFDWDKDAAAAVLQRAREAGVGAVITLGVTPRTSQVAIQQAQDTPMVYCGVGIHPWWVKSEPRLDAIEAIKKLATSNPKVRFIGEIGLSKGQNGENLPHQQAAFKLFVQMAKEVNMPINVHGGGAHKEIAAILREVGAPPKGGIIHSFNGTLEELKEYVELGMSVSFGLQVLRKMKGYEDVVRAVPEDRMVLETDANKTMASDVPLEPNLLAGIARDVAALRSVSINTIEWKTSENLERMAGPLR